MLRVADEIVLVAWLDHEHLTGMHRLKSSVQLDLPAPLQDHKHLVRVVDVMSFRVGAKSDGVKAQASLVDVGPRHQRLAYPLD
jgi:hypothetical protein